jgi:glycyl-tRNA synthetase
MKHSGRDLRYYDQELGEHYIPYVIEPSAGADRATLAFLCDAYREEVVQGRERRVLSLHYALAPIKCAVFPLLKNRPELVEKAQKLASDLKRSFSRSTMTRRPLVSFIGGRMRSARRSALRLTSTP